MNCDEGSCEIAIQYQKWSFDHYCLEASEPEESLEVWAFGFGRYKGKWLRSSARLL
jgi:hypothetical protein